MPQCRRCHRRLGCRSIVLSAGADQKAESGCDRLSPRCLLHWSTVATPSPGSAGWLVGRRTPRCSVHEVHAPMDAVVSERLGPSTAAFTLTRYQNTLPGMRADAAARYARLIDGTGEASR